VTVLVGGVAELYQGDLDLGRVAVERLAGEDLGPGVLVEELSYGAVAVMHRLEDLHPRALVLVGAAERERPPGTVERRRHAPVERRPEEIQVAVGEAVVGYVSVDLLLEVAEGLGTLPERTVAIEVEPASREPSETLSPPAQEGLERALALVREEVRRLPVLELADELRELVASEGAESTGASRALRDLLDELEAVDRDGCWGKTFAYRERLRREIAAGHTSEGMRALDWGLWWALIEELDRLQPVEDRIAVEASPNGGPAGSGGA
jgi:hydrogenase maturation protease